MTDRQTGRLIDGIEGRLTHTAMQTNRQANKETDRQGYKQGDRQTGRQAERQAKRQRGGQDISVCVCAVSYTHLTLPTNAEV